LVVLTGTETETIGKPPVHDTVAGRPVTAVLDDEKVQVDALVTLAARVTAPPVQRTEEGLAPKLEIDGADAGLTLIVVVAAVLDAAALATSFTV